MFKKTSQEIREEQEAFEAYERNKQKRLYISPTAVVPYPIKSRKVTGHGFERVKDSLPQKVIQRIK